MHERTRWSRAESARALNAYLVARVRVAHGDLHRAHLVLDGRVERVALEEEAEVARRMRKVREAHLLAHVVERRLGLHEGDHHGVPRAATVVEARFCKARVVVRG